MPRIRRRFLVDPTQVAVYHCIYRCVRHSFLCGKDPLSGKDYEHRRLSSGSGKDRMQFLAGQFCIDLLGFSVLSNRKRRRLAAIDGPIQPALQAGRRKTAVAVA